MKKDISIVFDYDLKIPEAEDWFRIEKNLNSKESRQANMADDDYFHDSFGLCVDDEKEARNHFYKEIRIIKSCSADKELEKLELHKSKAVADFKNFYLAVEYMVREFKPEVADVQKMLSLLFWYCGPGAVYDMVMGIYRETKENYFGNNDLVNTDMFLDFYNLYQRFGDYYLIVEGDVESAIKCYELYGLDWYDFINRDWDECEDLQEKEETKQRVLNARNKLNLFKNPTETIQHKEIEYPYEAIFSKFCKAVEDENQEEVRRYAIEFFNEIKSLKCNEESIGELRFPIRYGYSVREKGLEYILMSMLDNEEFDNLSDKSQKSIMECIKINHAPTLAPLRDFIINKRYSDVFSYRLELLKIIMFSKQIEGYLKVSDISNLDLAYYTTLNTFSYMLPGEEKEVSDETIGRLAVMNIAYMNDPNEGRTLQKCLFAGAVPFEEGLSQRKKARYPYVFIKCFTPQIDFLPMWEMYGDHAEGCCLVIDWNKINEKYEQKNVPLYNVCYLSKDKETYKVEPQHNVNIQNITELGKCLNKLSDSCNVLYSQNPDCIDAIQKAVNRIIFLFKDASYSYEKEVRICYQFPEIDKKFKHTNQSNKKLYVTTEFVIPFKEIILGPKFANGAEVIPYFQERIDMMCNELGQDNPQITFSDIVYV